MTCSSGSHILLPTDAIKYQFWVNYYAPSGTLTSAAVIVDGTHTDISLTHAHVRTHTQARASRWLLRPAHLQPTRIRGLTYRKATPTPQLTRTFVFSLSRSICVVSLWSFVQLSSVLLRVCHQRQQRNVPRTGNGRDLRAVSFFLCFTLFSLHSSQRCTWARARPIG